jgi:hypothetical protein
MQINLKKYIPHAAAVIIFAIVTLVYFKPLLSGKVLKQDDIARHKGMSKEIVDFRNTHKSEPLWTNSMFGGMPAYQISTLYPGNWIGKLDGAFKLFLPHPGGYLFLYCLGFFILLLCLGIDPWLAIIGSLAYAFSSYFLIIIEAGHNSKANALGYLPALIGGLILIFKGRKWLGMSLTALFTAMEINANHFQITYYGYILMGFIIVGYFFILMKEKKIKEFFPAFGIFIAASLVGVLPNAGNLLVTNEYGKYSTRGKSELTIDYASVRAARSQAMALDGKANPGEGWIKPGIINPDAHERFSKKATSGLDKDYATNWSYGVGETFTFLIPDFKGGPSGYIGQADKNALKKVNADFREPVAGSNSYFGDQPFTSGPVYIGAIIIFLAVLGMFVIRNPIKWAILAGTVLCTALAWGNNFMWLTDFFMDHVPGYSKFRAVSMLMVIPELTLPLLAVMGLNDLVKYKWNDRFYSRLLKKELSIKQVCIISAAVVGGFCLLGYLAPGVINTFHAKGEEERMVDEYVRGGQGSEDEVRPYISQLMAQVEVARKNIFSSDARRSLIFIALAFVALMGYLTGKIKMELLLAGIGIFVLVDLWTVDDRYLNEKSFITKQQNEEYITGKTAADESILRDSSLDYRVLNLSANTFNDASTSFYHKSIGGYHGAKLKKYQEIIDFHLDEEIDFFRRNAGKAFGNDSLLNVLLSKLHVINMLNTKYFIIPASEKENVPMPNKEAYGNAWFVKNVRFVADADSEIVGLYFIDPKIEALVRTHFKDELKLKSTYSGDGSIKLKSYEPNYLIYESDSKDEQFAVFSEIYYPKGWDAYVDGQLQPHACADYILRGMVIPAGRHKVEFKFEPKTYSKGNTVSMAGSALLALIVFAGLFLDSKRGKNTKEQEELKTQA